MLHRRLLGDDGEGVGEPLNETTIIKTIEYLIVGDIERSASKYRPLSQDLNQQSTILFGSGINSILEWKNKYLSTLALSTGNDKMCRIDFQNFLKM